MPVGTRGTIKGLTPEQISQTGSTIILANTYHMLIRPGTHVVEALGDLHEMMSWKGPILTDSGGFQVFSLAKLRKISEEGVFFNESKVTAADIETTNGVIHVIDKVLLP